MRQNTVPVSFLCTIMHVQHWTCVCKKCSHWIFKKVWKWQVEREEGRTVAAAAQSKLITEEHHISISCSGGEGSKEERIECSATGQ